MPFLTSVYYPTKDEREAMTDEVDKEDKLIKAAIPAVAKSRKGLTHGGLLLVLGRMWRSQPELRAAVRRAILDGNGVKASDFKGSSTETKHPKKRPSNAKTAPRAK